MSQPIRVVRPDGSPLEFYPEGVDVLGRALMGRACLTLYRVEDWQAASEDTLPIRLPTLFVLHRQGDAAKVIPLEAAQRWLDEHLFARMRGLCIMAHRSFDYLRPLPGGSNSGGRTILAKLRQEVRRLVHDGRIEAPPNTTTSDGLEEASEVVDAMLRWCAAQEAALNVSASSEAPAPAPLPDPRHNGDFTMVFWYGTEHKFALGVQSRAVHALWEEWERTGLGLHQQTIRDAIDPERDNFRMDGAFRDHPAFGTMIQSCGDGRYKLTQPEPHSPLPAPKAKKIPKRTPKTRRKRA